jgi:hypothetical protein
MKKKIIALIFLSLLYCYPQTDSNLSSKAYPEIGWDSLSCLIQRPGNYPEIARRSGLTTSLSVYLIIDSTGKILNVEPAQIPTSADDSLMNRLFISSIWEVLRSVKWVPSKKDHRPVNDKIFLLFNFYLFEPWERTFHILAPKYYERRD